MVSPLRCSTNSRDPPLQHHYSWLRPASLGLPKVVAATRPPSRRYGSTLHVVNGCTGVPSARAVAVLRQSFSPGQSPGAQGKGMVLSGNWTLGRATACSRMSLGATAAALRADGMTGPTDGRLPACLHWWRICRYVRTALLLTQNNCTRQRDHAHSPNPRPDREILDVCADEVSSSQVGGKVAAHTTPFAAPLPGCAMARTYLQARAGVGPRQAACGRHLLGPGESFLSWV